MNRRIYFIYIRRIAVFVALLPVLFASIGHRSVANGGSGSAVDQQILPATSQMLIATSVSAGTHHSCALTGSGSVVCWGAAQYDNYGQSSPPAGTFTAVSAGDLHTCGIKTNGSIACWGSNDNGQSSPPAGTFTAISAGHNHTCAIKTDGSIACWGTNYLGQSSPPAGTFTAISAGAVHTCAIQTDGTIACWGSNSDGQSAPFNGVFVDITAGHYHTCGLKVDGTVVCQGYNYWGQLDLPAGPYTTVSAGGIHTCAIKPDGTVVCVGGNHWGQLDAPAVKLKAISAGGWHNCGLITTDEVICWGSNENGQSTVPTDIPDAYHYALDGNTILAGTAIYVFNGTNWVIQAPLIPERNVEDWENYGVSIALQGDTAIVNSYGQDDHQPPEEPSGPGSMFIFQRNGTVWTQKQELVFYANFAESVDIDGDTIIVSDEGEYDAYINGVHFVEYNGNSWVKTESFATNDCCGPTDSSVAISGDLALARGISASSGGQDLVHVYRRTNGSWSEQGTLPYAYAYPPTDIDLDGNTAVIGNQVYITDGVNWSLQATLNPGEAVDHFGYGVAIEHNRIVISGTDKAFVFTRSGADWTRTQKLTVNGIAVASASVDISGNRVLVGKYVFDLIDAPPASELLVNGSFEVDANHDFVPDGWTRKDTLVDARRCNQAGKPPVAYDGNCAYMFKGGTNATARLFQTVNLNGYALQPGDKIKLTGFYHKQSAGTVYVRLFVNYATLPEDQGMVSMTKKTSGYQPIPALAKRLQAVPTRIHVLIQNKTTSGKTYVDGMSLKWVSKSGSGVIPLPPSADNLVPLPSGK